MQTVKSTNKVSEAVAHLQEKVVEFERLITLRLKKKKTSSLNK